MCWNVGLIKTTDDDNDTRPETNSSPLKIDGWKMQFPFCRGYVSFREGTDDDHRPHQNGDRGEIFHIPGMAHCHQTSMITSMQLGR